MVCEAGVVMAIVIVVTLELCFVMSIIGFRSDLGLLNAYQSIYWGNPIKIYQCNREKNLAKYFDRCFSSTYILLGMLSIMYLVEKKKRKKLFWQCKGALK